MEFIFDMKFSSVSNNQKSQNFTSDYPQTCNNVVLTLNIKKYLKWMKMNIILSFYAISEKANLSSHKRLSKPPGKVSRPTKKGHISFPKARIFPPIIMHK